MLKLFSQFPNLHKKEYKNSMASLWIIDAFNFIRQSKDLAELELISYEKAKEALINRLKEFANFSGERVLSVFDATGSLNRERVEEGHGLVKVIYTKGGEIADEAIIELARQKKEGAVVVSSDREIIEAAQKAGSSTLSSLEFERILSRMNQSFSIEDEETGFDFRHGTKKKGPAHRRPKKERKVAGKIQRWMK